MAGLFFYDNESSSGVSYDTGTIILAIVVVL